MNSKIDQIKAHFPEDGFFVYMLRCADGTLYTGWTTNIANRLRQHEQGLASKYTRARLPLKLAFIEQLSSRSAAQKREFAIKKLSRLEKERLIAAQTMP